jgi:hypothetical protein
MSHAISKELFESLREKGHEVIAKINANAEASASLHQAIGNKDAAAIARVLQGQGLKDIKTDQVSPMSWTDFSDRNGAPPLHDRLKCTHYVYWLELTYDPYKGLDWRVVEGCDALSE